MPRFVQLFLTIVLLSVFLVACGANTESDEATNEVQQEQTEETQEEEVAEHESDSDNENVVPQQENQKDEQKISPSTEMKIKYSFNGKSVEETAIWQKSDNQEFGLFVLPSYVLTAEEPRNDQVYFSEDGSHYMRISILPGDSNIDEQKENTLAELKAVNEEVKTLSPPEGDFFKKATVMQTKLNDDLVTAYLIPQNDSLIKLKVVTKEQENHLDAFIQMAKHIKVK